jgi:hypothetical protein
MARLIITEAAIRMGKAFARLAAFIAAVAALVMGLARFLFCASLPGSGPGSRVARRRYRQANPIN